MNKHNNNALKIDYRKKGDLQKVNPKVSSVLSSHEKGWNDLTIISAIFQKNDSGFLTSPQHQIPILLKNEIDTTELWIDGEYEVRSSRIGNMRIIPSGATYRSCWSNNAKFAILSFSTTWLEQINSEMMGNDNFQLIPMSTVLGDPLIHGIQLGFLKELETKGMGGDVYVDQLKNTLGVHLLRNYTTCSLDLQNYSGGLTRPHLRQVLEYIEANLHQTIRLDGIAQQLNMSQYYFCRLFKDSMGVSPYKYVLAQRVERAKQLMRQSQHRSLADIALDCGFSHQSHLSKHFRRMTGSTPSAYKKDRR